MELEKEHGEVGSLRLKHILGGGLLVGRRLARGRGSLLLLLLLLLLELEGAEIEGLEAFDVLDDALLGDFFLVGRPPPQNLLQALDLHQALLDGRMVRVGLQHLKDDLKLAVLLLLVDLLLAERAR